MSKKKKKFGRKAQAVEPIKTVATVDYKPYVYTPCHTGPVEVVPHLFLGNRREVLKMPKAGVDTIVSLYSLDGDIWETGFRGEIIYCPIDDYSVLPDDVADGLANKIIDRLASGHVVGISCFGGHGRTGYVAAIVLGKMGYADPIEYVREHYCEEAIESNIQIMHIAEMLDNPELAQKHEIKEAGSWARWTWPNLYSQDDSEAYGTSLLPRAETVVERSRSVGTCETCDYHLRGGFCSLYETYVRGSDPACDDYIYDGESW